MPLSPLYSQNINKAASESYVNKLDGPSVQYLQKDDKLSSKKQSLNTGDVFDIQNINTKACENLYNEFLKIKNKQGCIGKLWDGFKNLLHLKNSSNNVENTLKQAKNSKDAFVEAAKKLDAYKEGQKMCVDVAGDIISGIVAVGAAALAPVTGGTSLFVAAGAGAMTKTAIKASDSAIAGRDYKLDDLGYDLITGSINGAIAPLSNAIGGAAGTGVAKALGLEAVETCAKGAAKELSEAGVKQAGKSFLTRLLAKQGLSYAAKEGTKGGAALIAAKAITYGVDMTVDGALSGTADAFSRALAEGRIDDMPKDMAHGAFGGAIGGLLIGGSTRLIFSGASKLNKKIFTSFKQTAEEINFAKTIDAEPIFLNLSDDVRNKINSNPAIKAFYSSLDETTFSNLTSEQIARDLKDVAFMKALSADFSKGVKPGSDEAKALAKIISKRNTYLEMGAVSQFKSATSGTNVTYYDRSKSLISTLNKLDDKVSKINITSFDEANELIADGIGTRAVFNSLNKTDALKALENGGISPHELKALKNIWQNVEYKNLSETQRTLLSRANNILAEAQTQDFIDRLSLALRNNEISMTEINNYAGEGGIAYFSERQIKQIRDAWLESADAQNGCEFKIVTNLTPDGELASDLGFSREYIEKINAKSYRLSGYTTCQSNFKYKNGALGEGQFRGAEIQQFAEYEHFPYDIKKQKDSVAQKILRLQNTGKTEVANQLIEYRELVKTIAKDKKQYGKYNDYLREVYNFLRKKELGIFEILGIKNPKEPVLNIQGLTPYQNELLSKKCLESLSKEQLYIFSNPKDSSRIRLAS